VLQKILVSNEELRVAVGKEHQSNEALQRQNTHLMEENQVGCSPLQSCSRRVRPSSLSTLLEGHGSQNVFEMSVSYFVQHVAFVVLSSLQAKFLRDELALISSRKAPRTHENRNITRMKSLVVFVPRRIQAPSAACRQFQVPNRRLLALGLSSSCVHLHCTNFPRIPFLLALSRAMKRRLIIVFLNSFLRAPPGLV
jgi:hypothetical protein